MLSEEFAMTDAGDATLVFYAGNDTGVTMTAVAEAPSEMFVG